MPGKRRAPTIWPRLDAKNLDADDVLLAKRLTEIAELVEKLTHCNPTKIAIEAAYRDTHWSSLYQYAVPG